MTGPVPWSRVHPRDLKAYLVLLYQAVGTSAAAARIIASAQVETDLCGVATHGSRMAPRYLAALADGRLKARPRPTVLADGPVCLALDADHAPGPLAAATAMRRAQRRAASHGMGVVTVRGAGHPGAVGTYAAQAARAGLVGIVAAQTSSPSVAPHGGSTPVLGNTALAIAVPGQGDAPVLLDMACGALSWGRVRDLSATGKKLPPGAALDIDGRPTRSPQHARVLRTFGGAKGSALAMVLELLVGALTGSSLLPSDGEGRGLLCLALAPWHLEPGHRLGERVVEVCEAVRTSDGALGTGTRIPGDRAWSARRAALVHGIPLAGHHLHALTDAGRRWSVDPRLLHARPPIRSRG
jgi:LDH2 family malate/lactate/ureidoglycolate dehydrogenase